MPPKPFRVAKLSVKGVLPRSNASAHSGGVPHASTASKEKMQLLTYKMAFAQPNGTVPLLANKLSENRQVMRTEEGAQGAGPQAAHALDATRRWVREPDELCVASIRRSNNINKMNTYVATYKFDDPHWQPFLLPEIHVLPSPTKASSSSDDGERAAERPLDVSGGGGGGDDCPPTGSSGAPSPVGDAYNVYIDYNKLLSVELLSRHANYALRHLVQKGHAMYFVNYAQHSLLEMRGLVEASYITCAYGIKGERLRTHLLHVGPLDVRDVVEVDAATGRSIVNLKKKGVRKGVVAVSLVEGYGTWFQRKPMLWQRTRRVGALQSQLGAFDYQLCASEAVGKTEAHEVSLLEPHVRLMGTGGGAEAVGIIASSQVAQNNKLYVGQFEAPVITALDAVHQLMHRVAVHNRLVRPAEAAPDPTGMDSLWPAPDVERHRRLEVERLLPVSWVTRTPPPYVPLEVDLPFRIQVSKPSVFHTEGGGGQPSSVVFPTGGTVGSPMVKGVPLSLFEYNMHQGVDHYIFDDAPSARPTKWWSQKSNMPYNGHMYCMRSGLLDYVVPAEAFANPLASPSSAAHRRSSALSQQWKRERRRRRSRLAQVKRASLNGHEHEREKPRHDKGEAEEESGSDGQPLTPTTELWRKGQTNLTDHDEASLAAEDALLYHEEQERYSTQRRPPLESIVPPSPKAAERTARYEHHLLGEKPVSGQPTADALVQRKLRQRALKSRQLRRRQKRSTDGVE